MAIYARPSVTLPFKAEVFRKCPDPEFGKSLGMYHYTLYSRGKDLPKDIPTDPNPRERNIDLGVYKEVAKSFRDEPDNTPRTFHLKNKGITILAETVDERPGGDFLVTFGDGDGIVDGAHTSDIVLENAAANPDQWVKIELITRLPRELVTEIAGGLNTSVAVQTMSLANLDRQFDWFKDILDVEPYGKNVAYKQNETGKAIDARDIVAILTMFNIGLYPNETDEFPINAYRSKEVVLDRYLKEKDAYRKLAPIVKDILVLHDLIASDAQVRYNAAFPGSKGGRLHIIEGPREKKPFEFPFLGKSGPYRLSNGALIPMLGAFRYLVELDDKLDLYRWKDTGFDGVRKLWAAVGGELVRTSYNTSIDLKQNLMALGKSRSHWQTLYNLVGKRHLESK